MSLISYKICTTKSCILNIWATNKKSLTVKKGYYGFPNKFYPVFLINVIFDEFLMLYWFYIKELNGLVEQKFLKYHQKVYITRKKRNDCASWKRMSNQETLKNKARVQIEKPWIPNIFNLSITLNLRSMNEKFWIFIHVFGEF